MVAWRPTRLKVKSTSCLILRAQLKLGFFGNIRRGSLSRGPKSPAAPDHRCERVQISGCDPSHDHCLTRERRHLRRKKMHSPTRRIHGDVRLILDVMERSQSHHRFPDRHLSKWRESRIDRGSVRLSVERSVPSHVNLKWRSARTPLDLWLRCGSARSSNAGDLTECCSLDAAEEERETVDGRAHV